VVVGKRFCEESIPDAIVEHVTFAPVGFVTVHAIIPGVGIRSAKQFETTSRPDAHVYVVIDSGVVTRLVIESVQTAALRVDPVGQDAVTFAVAGVEVPAAPCTVAVKIVDPPST
jgi:hypothetical protein